MLWQEILHGGEDGGQVAVVDLLVPVTDVYPGVVDEPAVHLAGLAVGEELAAEGELLHEPTQLHDAQQAVTDTLLYLDVHLLDVLLRVDVRLNIASEE